MKTKNRFIKIFEDFISQEESEVQKDPETLRELSKKNKKNKVDAQKEEEEDSSKEVQKDIQEEEDDILSEIKKYYSKKR